MKRKVYIVRHCSAEGQPPEAQLTKKGVEQSELLRAFFSTIQIDRVISSPYVRAIQSIEATCQGKGLTLDIIHRLSERILSRRPLSDWLERLKETYSNQDLKFEGGESSNEAMNRVISLVDEIKNSDYENTIIVTHGNLMSLLLKYYDQEFGFEQWKKLTNPDLFLLTIEKESVAFKRIWKD